MRSALLSTASLAHVWKRVLCAKFGLPSAPVAEEQESIEHELIRTGSLVDFQIVDSKVEPTAAGDDCHVRITLQMPEDDVESFAFALVFVLGLLSFHDGRPRGYSGRFIEDDDEWRADDMLRHLEFRGGRLHFYADYVRGRCIKTTVEVTSDGFVTLDTVNRGEAALRWIDKLKGKSYLQAVE